MFFYIQCQDETKILKNNCKNCKNGTILKIIFYINICFFIFYLPKAATGVYIEVREDTFELKSVLVTS